MFQAKNFAAKCVVLMGLLCTAAAHAVETGLIRKTLPSDAKQEYWLRVPGNYDANRKYPLIITLHGMGNHGKQYAQLWKPDRHSPPDKKVSASNLIFLAPTFKGQPKWWDCTKSESGREIDEMMDLTLKAYNIDKSLVFMHGFSAGGACAWTYLWRHNKDGGRITGGVFLTGGNCWNRIVPDKRYNMGMPWFIEVGEGEWNLANLGRDGEAARDNLKKEGYKSVEFHKILKQGHSISAKAQELIWAWMWTRLNEKEAKALAKLQDQLASAKKHYAGGRAGAAAVLLTSAASISIKNPLVTEAKSLRGKILGEAKEALSKADALMNGKKYGEALLAYQNVADRFKGLPESDKAAEKVATAKKDPTVTAALEKVKKLAEASKRLDAARKLEEAKAFSRALVAYDAVAKQYGDTPSGKAAVEAARKIRGNKALMAKLKTAAAKKEADGALRRAKNYFMNGMKAQATKLLKDLIKKYPGTETATKAQALLDKHR